MVQKKPTKKSTSKKTPAKKKVMKKKVGKKQKHRFFGWLSIMLCLKIAVCVVLLLAVSLFFLDITVRSKFEGKKWAIPGKVYGRALELYEGLALDEAAFKEELTLLGYRYRASPEQPGSIVKSGSGQYRLHTRGFNFWDGKERGRRVALDFENGKIKSLRDSNNRQLSLVRLEPPLIGGIYPAHHQDRELVKFKDLPSELISCLIAVEDKAFYQHYGISFRGILRAVKENIMHGAVTQGGSTLTQQLVKNFYLNHERKFTRKIAEALMSISLELHYEKDEILESYVNEVYLGQSGKRAIHGFAMGSLHHFGQPLSELKIHQIALLVGLVKGPSYYDPRRHPLRATARRNLVLDIMAKDQILPSHQLLIAKGRPLDLGDKKLSRGAIFPAYLELVRKQLVLDYRDEDLRSEGLKIFTSFDPVVQKQSEESLTETIAALERKYNIKNNKLQGAIVVTNTTTGEVAAVVSDRVAKYAGFNRALDAVRPIGSLIKPAVYLTALEDSSQYTLASLISDAPVRVEGPDNELWTPKNFDNESHGDIPLYRGLAKSYNLATARLGMTLGVDEVVKTARRLGIEKEISAVPSLLLGAIELSPFEVATMYQTIASDGFYTPLRAIREVIDTEGNPLKRYPLTIEQRFKRETVYLLRYAMQAVMREGTGRSVYRPIPNKPIASSNYTMSNQNRIRKEINLAGKTGTTNDQRDSWFAGFDGAHLAVVWLGHDDNSATRFTGSSGALAVWKTLFSSIAESSVAFAPPQEVAYWWVDETTGLLSKESCENSRYLPFIEGSEPVLQAPCKSTSKFGLDWFKNFF